MSFLSEKKTCEGVEKKPGCIQSTLCVLGDKWSPLLIGQLVTEEKAFSELETALNGISPRTLSARLEKLVEEGIITKNQYNEHPPRFKYALTEKGSELQDILQAMADWGGKYAEA